MCDIIPVLFSLMHINLMDFIDQCITAISIYNIICHIMYIICHIMFII